MSDRTSPRPATSSPAAPRRLGWLAASCAVHVVAFAALSVWAGRSGAHPSRPVHVEFASPTSEFVLASIPDDPAPLPDAPPRERDVAADEDLPPLVSDDPDVRAPIAVTAATDRYPAGHAVVGLGSGGAAGGRGGHGTGAGSVAATPVLAPAPPPPPPSPVEVRPVGPTRAPRFAANPGAPAYPETARRRGWEGTVKLRLRIAPDGRVAAVEIVTSSGRSLLDDAAVAAADAWRFEPALEDGRPVEGSIDVPVRFRLE